MHKKWLLLMLVITLVYALALVGCSGGNSPAAEEVAAEEPDHKPERNRTKQD